MKAILKSIKPKQCANVMNHKQSILIIKDKRTVTAIQKLIDEYGYAEFYVYCVKDKKNYLYWDWYDPPFVENEWFVSSNPKIWNEDRKNINGPFNGKIKFKFRCYKIEEFRPFFHWCIEKETCLTRDEALDYLDSKDKFVGNPKRQGEVYAIYISDLEIFDKPKELSEFKNYRKFVSYDYTYTRKYVDWELRPLTKAPQNSCYVEVE